ncbi:MAG: zinc-ribbon domain-containing protein [Blastocatellia bacterium]
MFCPRCGAQNKLEQKFCRNCGLSLPFVRLALEGKGDEAAAELKRSYDNLGPAVGTLGFFILAALINFFLWDWGTLINLVLGVLITIGWFHKGFKQMERVLKTLEGKGQEQSARPAITSTNQSMPQVESTAQPELSLPPVRDTDPILAPPAPPAPASIAEHTTLELKAPEPRR